MHILAGCAADRASYEASRYGQGLLTYSLLLGMRGAALREDQFVDVEPLFSFATNRVPELAKYIGGIQQPVVASPGGQSFDIGQLTAEDKALIPLQAVRPLVLRSNFQDDKRLRDHLELGRRVNEQLRASSCAAATLRSYSWMPKSFPARARWWGVTGWKAIRSWSTWSWPKVERSWGIFRLPPHGEIWRHWLPRSCARPNHGSPSEWDGYPFTGNGSK